MQRVDGQMRISLLRVMLESALMLVRALDMAAPPAELSAPIVNSCTKVVHLNEWKKKRFGS